MMHSTAIKTIMITVLYCIAFVSVCSAVVESAGMHEAMGGYITSIEIAPYSYTDHWQGYYGVITTEKSPIYNFSFNVSPPGISTIRKLELGAVISEGDYLLVTSSPIPPVLSELRAGNVSGIDVITGKGFDSGTNTFTTTSTYRIPSTAITLTNVPTTYTCVNSKQQFDNFKEGLMEEDDRTLVFAIPISTPQSGYDNTKYNFQFIVPTNYTDPLTYYMYYVPFSLEAAQAITSTLPDANGNNRPSFNVISVQYNETTRLLEIVYRNNGQTGEFFKSSLDIFADGVKIATVNDNLIHYIKAGQEPTVAYYSNLMNYTRNSIITAQVSSDYGWTPGSLNWHLTKILGVNIIPQQDNSGVEVSDLEYDTFTRQIKLTLENTGEVPCYASPAITLILDGSEETFLLGKAIPLRVGEKSTTSYNIELTKADLAGNPEVLVHVSYGEDSTFQLNSLNKILPLKVVRGLSALMIIISLLAVILLIVLVRSLLNKLINKESKTFHLPNKSGFYFPYRK